jgi:hypothetical protein
MNSKTPFPCPFCGCIPSFEGDPSPRDDNRYYVYVLDCQCNDMEVPAGTWREYNEEAPIKHSVRMRKEWAINSRARAINEWNSSFEIEEVVEFVEKWLNE